MKKKLIGFLIAVAVIAIVAVGGPGLVGRNSEQALQNSLNTISVPGLYRIEITNYRRGWFSSHASSRLVLEGQLAKAFHEMAGQEGLTGAPPTLTFEHDVEHGPFLWTDSGPKLGVAYAKTELYLPPAYMFLLQGYLKGKGLFSFNTVLDFSGGSATHVTNPAYSDTFGSGITVRWDGIDGEIVTDGQSVRYSVEAPKLRVETHDGILLVDSIDYTGQQQRHGQHLWLGHSKIGIPEIRVESARSGKISLKELTYTTTAGLDQDGRVDYSGEVRIAGMNAPDTKMGESAWSVAMNNLPADALDRAMGAYYTFLQSLGDKENAQQALSQLFNEAFEPIFQGPVELKSSLLLDLTTPKARIKGNSTLTVAGKDGEIQIVSDDTINALKVDDVNLTDSAAKFTLSGLDGEKLAAIYRDVISLGASNMPEWQRQTAVEALIEKKLPELLGPKSRLSIDNLALNVPQGTAVVNGSIGLDGSGPLTAIDEKDLLARLKGSLSATISEGAMIWAVSRESAASIRASLVSSGRDVSDDTVEKLAQTAARGRINAFEAQGLVRRRGDDFVIDAHLDDGTLILNGVPRPDLLAP